MTDKRPKKVCRFCGAEVRRLGAHIHHFHLAEIAAREAP